MSDSELPPEDEYAAGTDLTEEEYVEETQQFERADEGFEADFTVTDTQVPDHPVVVEVPNHGQASAYLAKWELLEEAQESENADFGADEVADIIAEHYVSPSFDGLTGDDVRNMHLSSPDHLLEAIMPGMNTSVNSDGSATVNSAGN